MIRERLSSHTCPDSFLPLFDLYKEKSAGIVDRYSAWTKNKFVKNGVPVIICARNEEASLPVTLIALARSIMPVTPIVIDNKSTDSTYNIAEEMGATVLTQPTGNKMAAIQNGLNFAVNELSSNIVLMTDADSLPMSRWVMTMLEKAGSIPISTGGTLSGPLIFFGGESHMVDHVRSARIAIMNSARTIIGFAPHPFGANMLIKDSTDGAIFRNIFTIDPDTFYGSDRGIQTVSNSAGGTSRYTFDPRSTIFTHGDRFDTLADLVKYRRITNRFEKYPN